MSLTARSFRNIAAAGLVTLPFVAIVASWFIWKDNLPENLPTQWSGDTVVSTQPTIVVLLVSGTTALLSAGFAINQAALPPKSQNSRLGFLLSGLFGALTATIWMISSGLAATAGPNIQPAIGSLGLVVIASPLYGLIVFFVARRPRPARIRDASTPLMLSATETASWSQIMTVPAFAWVSVASTTVAIGVVVSGPVLNHHWNTVEISSTAALTLIALICAALASIRVTGDHRGLRVSSRLIPLVARTIKLERMLGASSTNIRPIDWGGWGYRILPTRSAIVLRGGEGVVISLKNGHDFAVTVDNSSTLASVLSGLLDKPNE